MEQENEIIELPNGYKMQDKTLIVPFFVKTLNNDVINVIVKYNLEGIRFSKNSELEIIENCFYPAKNIIKHADFSNCKKLKVIQDNSFRSCWLLKELNFSNCENLSYLGKNIIYNCNGLDYIDFTNCKNLKNIPSNSIEHSTGLKNVFLTNSGIESIENDAFKDLYELEIVDFTNCKYLKVIKSNAFNNCDLRTLNLSTCQNLEIIEPQAFSSCIMLKDVNLSNCAKLKTIENAFDKLKVLNIDACTDLRLGDISVDNKLTINSHLKNNEFSQYDDIISDYCEVYIKDKNRTYFGTNSEISKFRIGGTHLLNNLNYDIDPTLISIINCCYTANELKTIVFNKKNQINLESFVKKMKADNHLCYFSTAYDFCKGLGYFGFDKESFGEISKNEIISYKLTLAKDIIRHKLSPISINESNKKFATELIKRKTEKLAKMPIQFLVENFVLNNLCTFNANDEVLNAMKKDKFLNEIQKAKKQEIKNIKFAQFFVANIDAIKKDLLFVDRDNPSNTEYENEENKIMTLSEIINNFNSVYSNSNKLVTTRQNNQRLTLQDFKFGANYTNIEKGNEKLAELCGRCLITQKNFEKAQNLFNIAKKVTPRQILNIKKDDSNSNIKYEFIDKNNPVGIVLGYITNCCQKFDHNGESCINTGMTNPNSGFITIQDNGKIIAQSWVWYNEETKTIALDNIEVPLINYRLVNDVKQDEISDCIFRICKNFYDTMNQSGKKVENVIIGRNRTDVRHLAEDYKYNFISKLSKFDHPFGDSVYSDIQKSGQFIVYEDCKLFCKKKELIDKYMKGTEIYIDKTNTEKTM